MIGKLYLSARARRRGRFSRNGEGGLRGNSVKECKKAGGLDGYFDCSCSRIFFEFVNVGVKTVTKEMTSRSPLLQYFVGIGVREPVYISIQMSTFPPQTIL